MNKNTILKQKISIYIVQSAGNDKYFEFGSIKREKLKRITVFLKTSSH